MDTALLATMIFVSFVGLFLFPPWFKRQITESKTKSSGHLGKNEVGQMATTASDPFILMPDYLKTKDEMVAWMARDLPRLALHLHEGRRE